MKALFTAAGMASLDHFAIDELKISGLVLMENAGRGIAEIVMRRLGDPHGKTVHIYCGPGNNGGDGYVVARHLLNNGANVRVFILAAEDKIKGDAKTNLDILTSLDLRPEFIAAMPRVDTPDLIVDAMLGTGVKGPLKGLYEKAADFINACDCPVLAVDIPTGVNADTGETPGPAVRATVTATMAAPKRGLLFSPGREFVGELEIVDISMPPAIIEKHHSDVWLTDEAHVKSILPRRPLDVHKNRVGVVHVVAGSIGFTGAAVLTSNAVLRSGAGLCYLAVPKSLNAVFESTLTEVITMPFEDNGTGCLCAEHAKSILDAGRSGDVIAVGPGLGQAPDTKKMLFELLAALDKPLVLDADGLNLCAGNSELLEHYRGDLVLTPHPGELARLTGLAISEITSRRIEVVREYAQLWDCCLVLKGGPSIIGLPGGTVLVNSTGNAGMATAGSGDVLTGIIAGLMGQGLSAEQAAVAGVFVHGLAGDYAAADLGQMGMMAGDILNHTAKALDYLNREID